MSSNPSNEHVWEDDVHPQSRMGLFCHRSVLADHLQEGERQRLSQAGMEQGECQVSAPKGPPYTGDPGDVGRDAGEHGGFALDVAAQAGDEAGDAMDLVLPIHRAVEGASGVTLRARSSVQGEERGYWGDAGGEVRPRGCTWQPERTPSPPAHTMVVLTTEPQ